MSKVTHLTPDRGSNPGRQKTDGAEGGASTGEVLRAARERRGEDLTAAARVLRIRKDHLQALEENRLEALPGRAYALGFTRSYAEYLGLHGDACVDRFKRETAGRNEGPPQIGFLAEPEPLVLPYGRIVLTVLIALAVVYGGYYLFRANAAHSLQPVAPVPARIALGGPQPGPAPVHRHAVRPASAAQTPAGVPPASVAAPTASSGNSAAPAMPENLPVGQIFGKQNKNVRVVLHARSATHLLVQGPGGRVYINRILHPGDAYRVPNLVGLLLTTPDGGAVSLELDGQDIGLAGRPGQMTEALSLDPQAIVDRSNASKRG
ncbi:MAG: helix-turn-helix domain-containing protein [Rhizomicrobium sp.]